ncbi:uncharacterized protein G2W53_034371 [Senna tora]|uniref:Uncharacterized protein n=1 Tax=Senna tora TaxID=362788 RepID=A0A834SN53_9FABA|nr:uncharacterized protein G2W53_037899 [Senna tora]KAF7813395.1 uncharacterized protein G2W53_034371 [Senna tora]
MGRRRRLLMRVVSKGKTSRE